LVNRNSQGIYKTLKNLPKKPDSLTIEGIHDL